MIDTKFRSPYQRLIIEPLLRNSWINRLSPIAMTSFGLALGLMVTFFLWSGSTFAALGCLALSGFCDTLDGSLARFQNRTSNIGAALDITADRAVEFSLVMGLFAVNPETRGFPCLLMLGSILLCITTFLVVGIFSENNSEKSFHYSTGLIERAEAFLFFGAMIALPHAFGILAYLFSSLVALTAFIRIRQFALPVKKPDIKKT